MVTDSQRDTASNETGVEPVLFNYYAIALVVWGLMH